MKTQGPRWNPHSLFRNMGDSMAFRIWSPHHEVRSIQQRHCKSDRHQPTLRSTAYTQTEHSVDEDCMLNALVSFSCNKYKPVLQKFESLFPFDTQQPALHESLTITLHESKSMRATFLPSASPPHALLSTQHLWLSAVSAQYQYLRSYISAAARRDGTSYYHVAIVKLVTIKIRSPTRLFDVIGKIWNEVSISLLWNHRFVAFIANPLRNSPCGETDYSLQRVTHPAFDSRHKLRVSRLFFGDETTGLSHSVLTGLVMYSFSTL